MAKQNFGSAREDKERVLTTLESLLHLGEPFQVHAVPSASPRSGQDAEVEILWGDHLVGDVTDRYTDVDGSLGRCDLCGSYNPAVLKMPGCQGRFHRE